MASKEGTPQLAVETLEPTLRANADRAEKLQEVDETEVQDTSSKESRDSTDTAERVKGHPVIRNGK